MKHIQQYAFFMKEGSSKKAEVLHEEDDLMPLIEAANRLRITSGSLRRWVRNGRIEAIRRPSSKSYIYIRKAVIDAILTPLLVNALRSEQLLPSHMSTCPQC